MRAGARQLFFASSHESGAPHSFLGFLLSFPLLKAHGDEQSDSGARTREGKLFPSESVDLFQEVVAQLDGDANVLAFPRRNNSRPGSA